MNQQLDFLLLAVLLASGIQLSLGYLPAKQFADTFFSRCTVFTSVLWFIVGMAQANAISFAAVSFTILAWWNFRKGEIPAGKIFLSISSAIGVTLGIAGQGLVHRIPELPFSWNYQSLIAAYFIGAVLTTTAMLLLIGRARNIRQEIAPSLFVTWLKAGLLAQGLQFAFVSYALSAVLLGGAEMEAWRSTFIPDWNHASLLGSRLLFGIAVPLGILGWLLRGASKERDYQPDVRILSTLAVVVFLGILAALRIGF